MQYRELVIPPVTILTLRLAARLVGGSESWKMMASAVEIRDAWSWLLASSSLVTNSWG